MKTIHVCNHTTPEALYPFDARGVAKRFRDAAIFAGGGGNDDLRHPGHLGGNGTHQQGRGEGGGATGHINAHPLQGHNPLP